MDQSDQLEAARAVQIRKLTSLIGESNSVLLPHLIVYGYRATGKTTTVNYVLSTLNTYFAVVNCTGIHDAKTLFIEVISQFEEKMGLEESSCTSMDFVAFCKRLYDISVRAAEPMYVVLENVDCLVQRNLNNLLEAMLKIPVQLGIQIPLSVILVTSGISDTLNRITEVYAPAHVFFPLFDDKTILTVITMDCKDQIYSHKSSVSAQSDSKANIDQLLSVWVTYIYRIIQRECKVWTELRYLILRILPVFVRYIEAKENLTAQNTARKLCRITAPYVSILVMKLFHHNISFQELDDEVKRGKFRAAKDSACKALGEENVVPEESVLWDSKDQYHENQFWLPDRTICLIIASFLASFNPTATDTIFFTNMRGKRRTKMRRHPTKKVTISQRLVGPNSFDLQRMLAMYYGLVSENLNEAITNDETVFMQISNLTRMQLLTRISQPSELNHIVYRCNANYEFVEKMAARLSIPLNKYLYEA